MQIPIPKSTTAELDRSGISNGQTPHRQTSLTIAPSTPGTAFPAPYRPCPEPSPSPRGHLCDAVSGNEAQLADTRKRTARVSRRIPFKHFTSLFPGFHSIASPANRARFALQRHKEADGKLSTCLIAGNQRFTLHLPLSFPSSTKHRPELKKRKPQRAISIQDANLL